MKTITVKTLVPWFGNNRMNAAVYGQALAGCKWVGILFAGGMAELPHITARTILVNDLHRQVINLARVAASENLCSQLLDRLRNFVAFHPDQLAHSQQVMKQLGPYLCDDETSIVLAQHYFICCWMGRSGKAGTKGELEGRPAVRWNAAGGDSVVRFLSATETLNVFGALLRRCQFETLDVFKFLEKCHDRPDHGIYGDPPFPDLGDQYLHCPAPGESVEWHTRLAWVLNTYMQTRVVMRFYDHPLVRELYKEKAGWRIKVLPGRNQANKLKDELLLVLNAPAELF